MLREEASAHFTVHPPPRSACCAVTAHLIALMHQLLVNDIASNEFEASSLIYSTSGASRHKV